MKSACELNKMHMNTSYTFIGTGMGIDMGVGIRSTAKQKKPVDML